VLTLAIQLFASFLAIVVVGGALVACHDVLARVSASPVAHRPPAFTTFPRPRADVATRPGRRRPVVAAPWAVRRAQAVTSD